VRDAALVILEKIPGTKPVTVGGDKGFDTHGFVAECLNLGVTSHVAQNHQPRGGSAIDGRTTRHTAYALSQKKRKRIEECFGWLKTIALMRKVRHRGVCKVHWLFHSRLRRLQSGAHAKPDCHRPGSLRCVSSSLGLAPEATTALATKLLGIVNHGKQSEQHTTHHFCAPC
jgi:hypothetical protein